LISVANTVTFALIANDVAYLGSVFLSMCMLLTIVRLCGFEVRKKHVIVCTSLGVLMLAVIVSSPMLPLYYKRVWLEEIGTAVKLKKEYGVLHNAYLLYLLGYFAAMIATILHSVRRKKMGDPKLAGFIAGMREDDILMITADHGCDPVYAGTDHTRENVPVLVYGREVKPADLGVRGSFSDVAATVADIFGIPYDLNGESFKKDLMI
jgi:hypothetical protein